MISSKKCDRRDERNVYNIGASSGWFSSREGCAGRDRIKGAVPLLTVFAPYTQITYGNLVVCCLAKGEHVFCLLCHSFPNLNWSPLTQGEKRGHSQNIQRNKQKLNLVFGFVSAHLGLGDLRDF